MTITDLQGHLESRLEEALASLGREAGADLGALPLLLERPKDPSHGDLGLPCFPFARALGRKPGGIASELAGRIPPDEVIAEVRSTGPFLNFRYRRQALAEATLRGVLQGLPPFGPWARNRESVVIDFSSPNIAKPFHLGHLRSTVIGAALRRIYRFTGHEVHGINHLGDWGAQFGKIMVAWERWGDEDRLRENPMHHLHEIYVRINREIREGNAELVKASAKAFRGLEAGEAAMRALWEKLRKVSLEAFQGPYDRLGVEFDHVTGESFYEDRMEGTVLALQKEGIARLSEGALVVDLSEEGLPPCILRKSDGTTIYATRDLAALFYRRETFGFTRALYVVGGEQKLHFRQLRLVLEKLGWPEAKRVEHVDFGLILFWNEEEGRWKRGGSREGNVIFLDEILDEAVAKVRRIIEEKNPDLPDKERVAEAIGVSAVVFNDLKNGRVKDVKFDWKEMLSFDGETGPYVQYAGARLASILRKSGAEAPAADIDFSLLEDAVPVLLTMQEFGSCLTKVIEKNEPSILTGLMIRTASEIHTYLRNHHVLSAEPPVRRARLALVAGARKLLETGLSLLGVASPEEM